MMSDFDPKTPPNIFSKVSKICTFSHFWQKYPSAKVPLARSVIGFNILWVKESTKCTLQSELKAIINGIHKISDTFVVRAQSYTFFFFLLF